MVEFVCIAPACTQVVAIVPSWGAELVARCSFVRPRCSRLSKTSKNSDAADSRERKVKSVLSCSNGRSETSSHVASVKTIRFSPASGGASVECRYLSSIVAHVACTGLYIVMQTHVHTESAMTLTSIPHARNIGCKILSLPPSDAE